MLTFEQISQNPRTVYDYAPAYAFRRVDLTSGGTRYVLSRTVYIGIDYGYFCKRDGAMRTGANYFAHLLVFDPLTFVQVVRKYWQRWHVRSSRLHLFSRQQGITIVVDRRTATAADEAIAGQR